ncbi:MAG TPA: carboxypeptidase-like regulatory domain-containing protein [Candidatus Elarobacter sp.]|nr:carboxypeptidase-like regulatory domain-containing protein [Candidatus Elarobacter sp.]
MTRARFALFVLPLALMAGCGGPAGPPAANYGSISGRVYDATTNAGIAGVVVNVDTILSATTASDGTYRIGTIPSGQYTMAVQAPSGYAPPNLNAPPYNGSIESGQTINVDIPLTKT